MSKAEKELVAKISEFAFDPVGFVDFAFQWGEPGTVLANETGLDSWQRDVLREMGENLKQTGLVQMAIRSGHSLAEDTNIPTPLGSVRFGDLDVGDEVFGRNGKPTKILEVFRQGCVDLYKVTFDDGSFTHCDKNHLWSVKDREHQRTGKDFITLSTETIMKNGLRRSNGKATARRWAIPTGAAVEFLNDFGSNKIHPYLLGVWLGDGIVGIPAFSKLSLEIVEKLKSLGYEISSTNGDRTHRILGITSIFTNPVFKCKSPERYIPNEYKFADVKSRTALLAGILDTDGVCYDGLVEYASTSLKLLNDVVWLARSLGLKVFSDYSDSAVNKIKGLDFHRCTIVLNENLFTVFHKKQGIPEIIKRPNRQTKYIESIEFSHRGKAMCIVVDADDGLFLANDFIVTHNSIGKSFLTSMAILWFMSTKPNPQVVVTANTKTQLDTKTWRELRKWHKLVINSHWFNWTATKFFKKDSPVTWCANAIAWNIGNPEAFAGTHEEYVLIIFDEASGIPDIIWETAAGAMTGNNAIWLAFGNPTQATGEFFECFNKNAHRWKQYQIDAATCKQANKEKIRQWREDYGEDSDFYRVRVRGLPPRKGISHIIQRDLVEAAIGRNLHISEYDGSPKILGVDLARFGEDKTAFVIRQGLMITYIKTYSGLNSEEIVDVLYPLILNENIVYCFIDLGYMPGVYDRLVRLGVKNVFGINFGANASKPERFANKVTEMYHNLNDWLGKGGCLPKDKDLIEELVGREYGFDSKSRLMIEKKDEFKAKIKRSPDTADALALTFAMDLDNISKLGILPTGKDANEYKAHSPFARL